MSMETSSSIGTRKLLEDFVFLKTLKESRSASELLSWPLLLLPDRRDLGVEVLGESESARARTRK
jgi:hypothetical protein